MNNMIIPNGTSLIVKEGEKLFVSREIIELAEIINVKVNDLLNKIIIRGTACGLSYFGNITIGNYGENAEVLLIAQSNIRVEIPQDVNREPLLVDEPLLID